MAIPKPGDVLKTVCAWDPAIDVAETPLAEFFKTRDPEIVKLVPGAAPPTYFHLRPLDTRTVQRWIKPAASADEQRERAFRAALIKVENLVDANEERHAVWQPKRYAKALANAREREIFDLLTDDEFAEFDSATVSEIGEVARLRSFFPRGISPEYVLPPTSSLTLATMTSRRVEQERRSGATGKGDPTLSG